MGNKMRTSLEKSDWLASWMPVFVVRSTSSPWKMLPYSPSVCYFSLYSSIVSTVAKMLYSLRQQEAPWGGGLQSQNSHWNHKKSQEYLLTRGCGNTDVPGCFHSKQSTTIKMKLKWTGTDSEANTLTASSTSHIPGTLPTGRARNQWQHIQGGSFPWWWAGNEGLQYYFCSFWLCALSVMAWTWYTRFEHLSARAKGTWARAKCSTKALEDFLE